MSTVSVTMTVNGRVCQDIVSSQLMLADYLHEKLGLTGTKVCCGIGSCKACTVALKPIQQDQPLSRLQACITPTGALDGREVLTVEGLAEEDGSPNDLGMGFLKHFAFQCGYSSPGFMMGATILMDELRLKPPPEGQIDARIQQALGQHVCRCSGYVRYARAIKETIINRQLYVAGS